MHAEHVPPEKNRHRVMNQGAHQAHDDEADPGCLKPSDEPRASAQAHHTDEDAEPDGVEDPDRWFGYAADERSHGTQPPEHEPHDESAAAGGGGERQPGNRDREEADEPPEHDAGAAEAHIRRVRWPGGVPGLP